MNTKEKTHSIQPYYKLDIDSLSLTAMNKQSDSLVIIVHKFDYRVETNQIGYSDKPYWYEYVYSLRFKQDGSVEKVEDAVSGVNRYIQGWSDSRVSVGTDEDLISMIQKKFNLTDSKLESSVEKWNSLQLIHKGNELLLIDLKSKIRPGDWFYNLGFGSVGQHNGAEILLRKDDKLILAYHSNQLTVYSELPKLPNPLGRRTNEFTPKGFIYRGAAGETRNSPEGLEFGTNYWKREIEVDEKGVVIGYYR